LRVGYSIILVIQVILSIIIFVLFITLLPDLISQYKNEGNIDSLFVLGIALLTILYTIIYCIVSLYYNQILINDEGIIIKNPDTNLIIDWKNVVDVVDNGPILFGRRKDIRIKDKVQLYNRGIWKIISFWYKTNTIPVSQYREEIIKEIQKRLKK
jgi:hypothetical protein